MGRKWQVLAVASAGGFVAYLDTTIVNTAFPSIAADFTSASRAELSWVLDAYYVVLAALLVPAGRLADLLGRKRLFLSAMAAFALASVLCALAPTWEALVGARVLQGVAAAALGPVSLALILPEFEAHERATAVGAWGATAALAAALGPPVGGILVELADWRWVFLVNVPVGLIVLVAGARILRETREADGRLPDLLGAALLAVAFGAVALGIVEGQAWGWGSVRVLGCFAGAVLALALVGLRSARHPAPVIELGLLRVASFARGNAGTLLFAMAFFAAILANILFLTSVWGYSVLTAGLATVPGPFTSALVAAPAGRLADRFGHRVMIVPGCLAFAAGLLVFAGAGPQPDYVGTWLPGSILNGIGIGLAFPTLGAAAVADLPAARFGTGSALNAAARQFGAVLGTAIVVAIIGDPAPGEALGAFSDAYTFAIVACVAAALVSLTLRPGARARPASAGAGVLLAERAEVAA